MAAHIKHTRRQMTAAADVRNSLLARKAEERQNAAVEREKHVRELLRVTEWKSKAGVGAFPNVQRAGEVSSRELLQFYITPFPDGGFPSLAELVQRHLEPTPEPEPTPIPSPPPIVIPVVEPELSAASPAVKTEEDDTLMESDGETEGGVDKSEPEDNDNHNDAQPLLELSSRGAPPIVHVPMSVLIDMPTYSSTPEEDVEMQLALPHTAPIIPSPSPPPPPAIPSQPPPSVPQNQAPVDDLPFAPSPVPVTHSDPPPPLPASQPPTPQKPIRTAPYTPTRSFRFDPNRPLNAPRPLSPPPPDARVPSLEALRGMMFPPEGEEGEEAVPAPPSVPILPTTAGGLATGTSVGGIVTPVVVPVPLQPTSNVQPLTVPFPPALPPSATISISSIPPTATTTAPITTAPARPQISTSPTTPTTNSTLRSPQTPKPLTNAYTASLPPLPPLPADLARKVAGVKVRRRGVGAGGGGGVNWGGSGVWSGAGAGGAGGANVGTGVMGPGGAGAQGWWASVSGGQVPAPGTSAPNTGMELLRWQAILQVNPAHVFARRPTKCVTTHEWRVLRHELEYTRAMQRIEQLKLDGAWSFRQPKKQRGPVLPKTHWDYLMDEMKWLQTDFREERRWKTVLAFELAHAVKDWHIAPAGSEERRAMCVGYERPGDVFMEDGDGEAKDEAMGVTDEEEDAVVEKDEEEVGPDGKAVELRSELDEEEVEEVEPEDKDEAHTDDPAPRDDMMGADDAGVELSQESIAEKEAVEASVGLGEEGAGVENVPGALTKDWTGAEVVDVDMVGGDGKEDDDADGEAEADDIATVVPATEVVEGAGDAKTREDVSDPLAGALRSNEAAELTLVSTARTELLEIATTASLTTTFTIPPAPPSPTSTLDPSNSIDALTELFPELSIYTGLSELDPDPNKAEKRPDESMSSIAAGKLAHASRLFDVKPVLVGALDPARHLFKNQWIGLDEVPAVEDGKDVGPIRQDTVFTGNYLFAPERKSEDKQVRRRPDSGMIHPMQPRTPNPPRDAAARLERITWTPEDDALLKSICDAYPNSWALIADVFNSSRVTIKPDMRTDWDCYDRWVKTFGGGMEAGAMAGADGGPMQLPLNQVRPGFPVEIALPSPGGTLNRKDAKTQVKRPTPAFENKKQVRQHFLYDTLRKVVRKRENAAKQNQPPKRTIPPPHETHSQLASGQRIYTPAELSKLKAERDARHYAEMVKRRQEIYQQAVAAGRPVPRMPPGLVNIPSIRNAQMNVHQMQMQMQQQQQQSQQQPQQAPQTPQPGVQSTPQQPAAQQPQAQQPGVPQTPDAQAQYAARMQTPLSASQRVMPNQQQAQAMMQAGINGLQQQMSPPTQATQSPNLHAPGLQAGPSIARPSSIRPGSGSPGIVNGQAMSHLLRTSGMHQMHMNLANGVVPPNMQQNAGMVPGLANGNAMFANGLVNGASSMRGQLGPEQMNQLLLQQAARMMQQQNQQQQQQQQQSQPQQPQLQVPSLQQSTPDNDVTMQ